ncbi:F0F1 ATP synthase subunit B [Agrobacterium sp. ES01]|uniref:F0F1 ATP synthase subunit B n=1 Tax=Agrobacterium sp. ES01 TaxID=3420714 RepID=UPI003D0CB91B
MFVTPAFAQETAVEDHNTETGVAHEQGHGGGAFPPFDQTTFPSQLLWLVITFGLFYMLMQKVIVPRVGGILESRHDRIAQDLDEAARLKSEADAAIETYERELTQAKAKGNEIASTARAAAKAKADAERTALEAELNAKLAAAEANIGEIKTKALAEVDEIASETVSAIVEQLIGAKATKADVKSALTASTKEA